MALKHCNNELKVVFDDEIQQWPLKENAPLPWPLQKQVSLTEMLPARGSYNQGQPVSLVKHDLYLHSGSFRCCSFYSNVHGKY